MAAARLAALLQARQQAVAVAECASGGLIASTFSRLREAPHFFRGGVVISHENAAQSILGIDSMAPTATEAHALQLARAVQERLGTEWAIGESGVAGPTRDARGCEPGVCALAIVGPGGLKRTQMIWPDDQLGAADAYGQAPKVERQAAMQMFSDRAIELAVDVVSKAE